MREVQQLNEPYSNSTSIKGTAFGILAFAVMPILVGIGFGKLEETLSRDSKEAASVPLNKAVSIPKTNGWNPK